MDPHEQAQIAEVSPLDAPPPASRGRSNWSFLEAPATYSLLGINCAVFLWMILHGVSLTYPAPMTLIPFGANNTYLVLQGGEWWRLLTAMFVHVGALHLATNMWCLWNLGLLGEPLLGKRGMFAVYILTGAAGNLLSMAYNVYQCIGEKDAICSAYASVGAGASGAVFGLAGVLIVLLSNRRLPIPWVELKKLRGSVIQFAILNLAIGLATLKWNVGIHIDNLAHLGGFFCGLGMGVPLKPKMTAGRERYLSRQKATFLGASLVLSLFGYWVANLR